MMGRWDRVTSGLAAFVVALMMTGLLIGPAGLGLPAGEAGRLILWEIRLPRAILGALIGGVLGLSGAVLQGYLRNPLAEPGIIGLSSGASLGAVTVLHSGLASVFPLALPLGGLVGAGLTTMILVTLAGDRGGPITLILAGVAVSSVATALTTLALNLSPNPFAAVEIVYWLMGSLTDRSLTHVWIAAPFMIVGLGLMLSLGRALDALSLGEDAAANLGIDLDKLRLRLVMGVALSVGAAAAIAGTIGFVGLIVPHLLRPYVGGEPARLLPASLFGGAALVLTSDLALRLLAPYSDLKLGVLTALIGAPFFAWLVVRTRRELAL